MLGFVSSLNILIHNDLRLCNTWIVNKYICELLFYNIHKDPKLKKIEKFFWLKLVRIGIGPFYPKHKIENFQKK